MKTLIVYSSSHGSTTEYVEWLAASLEADVCNLAEQAPCLTDAYGAIIVGGGVYAGKIKAADWLEKNRDTIPSQTPIFFFSVGMTDPKETKTVEKIWSGALSKEAFSRVKEFFHLPGKMDYTKLPWAMKMIVKFIALLEKDPQKKAEYTTMMNHVDKKHADAMAAKIQSTLGL